MNTRFKQRGAAALVVAMVLLFIMTLVAFFASRTMIFEQRTATNQYRYTKAFEVADAGIEWAIARLNDPLTLTANSCVPASGAGLLSFRGRYIRPTAADASHAAGWLDPVAATAFPGCQINPSTGALTCGCPAAGAATLAATDQPRFRVQFNPVTAANNPSADPVAVEIISRGCTNGDPCDPSQAITTATDGTAIARVLVKIRPTFARGPGAGLISGSTTIATGSLNVVNTDTKSNGITINTGSTVVLGNALTVQSLPGTLPAASILDNDPSLLKLTNADANGELFFSSFFGEGFSDYQTGPLTKEIKAGSGGAANGQCSGDLDCGSAVSYWVDRGFTNFWVGPDVKFNSSNMPSTMGGTLGTASKPVAVVTQGKITFTGGVTAYGVFYAATAAAEDDAVLGSGSANIVGSMVSRGDFARTGNGNISIIYNGNLFGGTGPPTGLLVPVPGSWRDKATPY